MLGSFFYYITQTLLVFFFFQAEDGIRDLIVTGVQTCALPISGTRRLLRQRATAHARRRSCPRPLVVRVRLRPAPPHAHAAAAQGALRGRRETGAAAGAHRAIRRAALVRAEGRARPLRPGREGALHTADALDRQDAARASGPRRGALLRWHAAREDPRAPAARRQVDRPERLPAREDRVRAA